MSKTVINELEVNGVVYVPKLESIIISQREKSRIIDALVDDNVMSQSEAEAFINNKIEIKGDQQSMAQPVDGMQYCIVRTYSAGVFAGHVKERNGREVELLNARRIWRWDGAASLSQLAVDGTSKPDKCRFPVEVPSVILLETIEIIPCTEKAQTSIKAVTVWAM